MGGFHLKKNMTKIGREEQKHCFNVLKSERPITLQKVMDFFCNVLFSRCPRH